MDWAVVASVSAGLGVLVSAAALISSMFMHRSQRLLANKIHHQTQLLSQRQLLLPLWQHLEDIRDINPNDPVWPDVVRAVNKLELVALLCEGEMVDRKVVVRTMREQYIVLYEKIEKCEPADGVVHKSGRELLRENRAAMKLYKDFHNEFTEQDQVKKLSSHSS